MILRISLILFILFQAYAITGQTYRTYSGDHLLYAGVGTINPTPFTFTIFSIDGSGNPSASANINYQYKATDRFLVGGFASYYRVNANYEITSDRLSDILNEPNLNDILDNLDCVHFGDCDVDIGERVSIYSLGAKLSYEKSLDKGFETYVSGYLGYSFIRRQTIAEQALELFSDELSAGVSVPTFIYFSSVGLRYYLNQRFAIQGELGFGNSHLINLGISYNMCTYKHHKVERPKEF